MGFMAELEERLATLIDFGHVTATSILTAASSVVLRVVGDEDPAGDEDLSECEMFGQAPLIYRPQDPTDAGRCEAMFVRWGDESVVIGTKDRRFQVEPAAGEVRIVALGADGARQAQVVLKPDGVIVLSGVRVEIGVDGASETIGLGTAIKGHFDSLKTYLDGHTHVYVDDSAGAQLTTPPASAALPSVVLAASPSVPDVESRHKVEN